MDTKQFLDNENSNFVVSYYKNNKTSFKFMISLLYHTIQSKRVGKIFNPCPHFITPEMNCAEICKLLGISKTMSLQEWNKCIVDFVSQEFSTDNEFNDKNPHLYMTIKFAICNLKKFDFIDSNFLNKEITKIYNLFEVKYQLDTNTEFKDEQNDYLFHGSPIENWYSILNNGMKVPDKVNKLLLNANAYGPGIYLSDSSEYSIAYSRRQTTGGDIILGVFQVSKEKRNYYKNTNIYVVPTEKEVKLRYLIQIKQSADIVSLSKSLNEKFGKQIKTSIKNKNIMGKKVGNKRLMSEFRRTQKLQDEADSDLGVNIECQLKAEDRLDVWNVLFHRDNIPKENTLYKQLEERNIDNIKLEVTFPCNYPIEPPFVRVVYPRFKYRTGHITLGGSVCMDILTNEKWVPVMTVDKVMLQIKMLLIDGDAELDSIKWNQEYGMQEACEAFARMVAFHNRNGW